MVSPEQGLAIISAPVDKAEEIARRIVESRCAACAQVTAEVSSIYWWKGRIENEPERLILLKTEKSQVAPIQKLLREIHPYDLPELVFLPFTGGSEGYLAWLAGELASPERPAAE